MSTPFRSFAMFLVLVVSSLSAIHGQVAIGAYPLGTYDSLGPDIINVGNLNLMLNIPVLAKTGRAGTNFSYSLAYNSSIWTPTAGAWTADSSWGWAGSTQVVMGYLFEKTTTGLCANSGSSGRSPYSQILHPYYVDTKGVRHSWSGTLYDSLGQCAGDTDTLSNTWSDDHQYLIGSGGQGLQDAHGNSINPPTGSGSTLPYGAGSITDTNGNIITVDGSGHFTDTTGSVALTVAGTAPSNETYTYTDPSGTSRALTVSYLSHNVATNFGCAGVSEYTGTSVPLVDTITMPDSTGAAPDTYHFTYETTPGVSGSVTGRIASITVPSGGVITYGYTGANNGISCADGSAIGLSRSLTTTSTPARTYTRTISSASTSHTTVVDSMSHQYDYDFVSAGSSTTYPEAFQTQYVVTDGSNTPLSQQTCYNGASQPCTLQSIALPITSMKVYSLWDGVSFNGSTLSFDVNGNVTAKVILDYGTSSAPGPPLLGENWYFNSSGLLTDDVVGDETLSGVPLLTETRYTYDSARLQSTSGVPQHTSGINSGNLTKVDVLLAPETLSSPALSTTMTYYDTGSIYSQTSPSGGITHYSYDSPNIHKTSVSSPDPNSVGMSSSATYDSYLGLLNSIVEPNGTSTSVSTFDALGRATLLLQAHSGTNLGEVTANYTPSKIAQVFYQGSGVGAETDTYYDSYGRTIRTARQSDSGHWYVTDTCYDNNGRVNFTSYPYKVTSLGSQVCSGLGDAYTYDALNRTKTVTHGDSASTSRTYLYYGPSTRVQDENNNVHIYQTDSAGRTTIVCEVTTIALNGVSPTSCGTLYSGTGFVTTYAYAIRQTTVTQGSQTRIFAVDGAGRTLSKSEPERNWTKYTYSNNSTGDVVVRQTPKAGQTDTSGGAGTVTNATTQYDLRGRPVSVTYDDSITPTKTFTYDIAPSGSSFNVGSAKGRMSSASTSTGASTLYSYDPSGRVQGTQQCIPGWCGISTPPAFTRSYTYDWLGNPLLEQYGTPSGTVSLGYTTNLVGQLMTVTGGQDTSLTSLYSATTQTPQGVTAASLGNGLSATLSYDPLGRPSGLGLMLGSTPVYAYTATWQGQHVASSQDSVNGTGTYGYDALNRLSGASIGTSAGIANLGWGYDRYGNRLSQSATGSYTTTLNQPAFTVDPTTNHLTTSGYTYDAVGNLWSDNSGDNYTYDAEGNVIGVSGGTTASFTYDALNQRVLTTINGATRAYGFNLAGQRATVWDGSGNLISAQYYAGGQPLAYYLASDGHVRFEHQDWIGTQRFRSTYTGTVEGSFTSLPFGDSQTTNSGSDTDTNHFAGLDRDTSDLQHATFREYSSAQARWIHPDPSDGSYSLADPQSLNRFAYVGNDPESYIDRTGLSTTQIIQCGTNENGDPVYCATVYSIGSGGSLAISTSVGIYDLSSGDSSLGGPGGGGSGAPNNYPVPTNPCLYMGNSLPPSAYAQTGAADANNPTNYLLDGLKGFPAGHYLDGQVLASGSVGQNRAYGNYTYGAFMAGAGRPLTTALIYANAYAFFKSSYPDQPQMDSTYSYLPAANVANITNGYNAARNGTLCHK